MSTWSLPRPIRFRHVRGPAKLPGQGLESHVAPQPTCLHESTVTQLRMTLALHHGFLADVQVFVAATIQQASRQKV
jgi:hypothetical protein